ncbi:hypothetical protein BACCOPRO_01023 [Phocaeicola coprophilus DSM 18228 = JCM 13818]|uniref:Uncharacterized protein n=1 Tax=Phocaeicola coprophilus DSM 18228 = JCM 13818 TaxID=547042 RepID=S0F5S0_9BACT|nr:hypothetical protein BACCOPRO_01023 [Phocaeicola coprophilus DSM 18228 = JCM 13818]
MYSVFFEECRNAIVLTIQIIIAVNKTNVLFILIAFKNFVMVKL